MDNRPEKDEREPDVQYERPAVVDHGSLAELTLSATGSYTDGSGFGGGS